MGHYYLLFLSFAVQFLRNILSFENVFFFPVGVFPFLDIIFQISDDRIKAGQKPRIYLEKGPISFLFFRSFIDKEKQFSSGLPISNVCIILFGATLKIEFCI